MFPVPAALCDRIEGGLIQPQRAGRPSCIAMERQLRDEFVGEGIVRHDGSSTKGNQLRPHHLLACATARVGMGCPRFYAGGGEILVNACESRVTNVRGKKEARFPGPSR